MRLKFFTIKKFYWVRKFFRIRKFYSSLKFKLIQESPQNIQRTESDGELNTQANDAQNNDGRVTNAENLGDLSQSIRDQSSKCKVSIMNPYYCHSYYKLN